MTRLKPPGRLPSKSQYLPIFLVLASLISGGRVEAALESVGGEGGAAGRCPLDFEVEVEDVTVTRTTTVLIAPPIAISGAQTGALVIPSLPRRAEANKLSTTEPETAWSPDVTHNNSSERNEHVYKRTNWCARTNCRRTNGGDCGCHVCPYSSNRLAKRWNNCCSVSTCRMTMTMTNDVFVTETVDSTLTITTTSLDLRFSADITYTTTLVQPITALLCADRASIAPYNVRTEGCPSPGVTTMCLMEARQRDDAAGSCKKQESVSSCWDPEGTLGPVAMTTETQTMEITETVTETASPSPVFVSVG